MKKVFILFIIQSLLLLFGSHTSSLFAGQVTLEISTTTGISAGLVKTDFRITNRGTETAHKVSVHGKFRDIERSVDIADRIGPGQSAQSSARFELPGPLHGSFPLYVTVSYQHANGVAASSASLARVNSGVQTENKLTIQATLEDQPDRGTISVFLKAADPEFDRVTITAHAPEALALEPPARTVNLQEGRGRTKFKVINTSGNKGDTYGVFFVAEYETNKLHNLATAEVAVPVADIIPELAFDVDALKTWLYALLLALAAIILAAVITSRRARLWLLQIENIPHLLDIFVLAAVEYFIFSRFDLPSLFSATITTGGDTASHYYTLEYLRHTLLPDGKITGWTMGNYAGFPILQFYFPLPFLIMSMLDLVMPLQTTFKLVTLLGTTLLPIAAYIMLRLLRCPFPGPGIGAALMLPFLFNPANSMWGGNILSTLAGEFSYSFSMALSLILIGSLYKGAEENKGVIRNGILVFLVGFSHGYTLLFAEAMSLFLLFTPYGAFRRAFYLFKVYALGFCLLAFWLVPLLVFTKFTTSYHLVWTIHSIKEVVPEIMLPVVVTGIAGSVLLLILGGLRYNSCGREALPSLAYLWFGLAAAVVFFVAAPRIGVVDIRYVPYGQLMICLMAALFLGWTAKLFLNRWGLNWILLIVAAAAVFHGTGARLGPVAGWFKWNYEGFEAKALWPVYKTINDGLAGDFQDPRVIYEHSEDHNMFGSSRAFESLPLFAGRATLEGLYMQASITAPFVFYIQSLVSHKTSQPFPQYNYTTMDYVRAKKYLELFNVKDIIVKSRQAQKAIRQAPGYKLKKSIGQYELWELTSNRNRYVEPLRFEPVLYSGDGPWKQVAHQWFVRDELLETHLVFENDDQSGSTPFTLTTDELDTIPRKPIDTSDCRVQEDIKNDEILLETDCLGKPHLVKVSYHPNWQVEGAEKIYLASPSFMLIYPEKNLVRLTYGPGPWDRLGQLMTLFGLLVLLLNIPLPVQGRETAWALLVKRFGLFDLPEIKLPVDPSSRVRKTILVLLLTAAAAAVAAGSYNTYINEPYRAYRLSIQLKDAKQYRQARKGFHRFIQHYPLAKLARESMYYIAITYYLEKRDPEAILAFEEYIKNYPQAARVAESHYHIGLVLLRSGKTEEGISRMRLLIEKYPQSNWAGYAQDRLLERGISPSGEKTSINRTNLHQYMGRAISYFNQDRLAEARPILLQISERFPDFEGAPQALAALALCYYKENDCTRTIKYYQKLIERYPDSKLLAEAYFHIGICQERTGNSVLSKESFRKVLAIDKSSVYGKQAADKIKP
ncbi:MAG: tetratricopeptide repeat protein [Deltaproteobacteria bacterium]|nr:tetratricopeptide repeat protein [Deltaproteobacteria bacterium]